MSSIRTLSFITLFLFTTFLVTTAAQGFVITGSGDLADAVGPAGNAAASAAVGVPQGLTVTGRSEVSVTADALMIRGELSAKAELASDALLHYASVKGRVWKGIEGLEIDGLEIKGRGLKIEVGAPGGNNMNGAFIINGRGGDSEVTPEVTASEIVEIRLPGVAQMEAKARAKLVAKILDKGAELGLGFGAKSASPFSSRILDKPAESGVFYVLPSPKEMEAAAYKAAIQDAGSRADQLAKLAGLKLGPINNIVVQSDPPAARHNRIHVSHSVKIRVTYGILP